MAFPLEPVWYTWVRPQSTKGTTASLQFTSDQWTFFTEVAEVQSSGESVDVDDPLNPTVHFGLANEEYWIRIGCPAKLGDEPPFTGAFIGGFRFEWADGSRISHLVTQYRSYAEHLDVVIGYITAIATHEISLRGYALEGDEEDTQSSDGGSAIVRVRLDVSGVGEVVIRVSLDEPLSYPRSLMIKDKPQLLRELKADEWDTFDTLVSNLDRLFSDVVAKGEVEEAMEMSKLDDSDPEGFVF